MHLTFNLEQAFARLRCEIANKACTPERQAEIASYIVGVSAVLARVVGGVSLPDDKKKRVLNTFLTLMILREMLERIANDQALRRRPPLFPTAS